MCAYAQGVPELVLPHSNSWTVAVHLTEMWARRATGTSTGEQPPPPGDALSDQLDLLTPLPQWSLSSVVFTARLVSAAPEYTGTKTT